MPRPSCRRSLRAAGRERWQQQLRPGAIVEGSTNVARGDPGLTGAPAASASAGAASAAQWTPCLGDEACWSRNLADPAFSGWSWLEPCEGDRGDLAPRSSRRFAAA